MSQKETTMSKVIITSKSIQVPCFAGPAKGEQAHWEIDGKAACAVAIAERQLEAAIAAARKTLKRVA